MAKRQRQQSLLSVWSGKRIRSEGNEDNYGSPASEIQYLSGEQQLNLHDDELHDQVDDINVSTATIFPMTMKRLQILRAMDSVIP